MNFLMDGFRLPLLRTSLNLKNLLTLRAIKSTKKRDGYSQHWLGTCRTKMP